MPPSRTMGLIEFFVPSEAKSAFKNLAYKQFKDAPLFLEWAPTGVFKKSQIGHVLETQGQNTTASTTDTGETVAPVPETPKDVHKEMDIQDENNRTLYVKNLNFSTTEESLSNLIESTVGAVNNVSIAKHNVNVCTLSRSFWTLTNLICREICSLKVLVL